MGEGALRARHPLDMPEGTDLELEDRGQTQLCMYTARWDPWFALYWWWAVVTRPLVVALALAGVKRMRVAEGHYLAARTALGRWSAYAEGMGAGRAAQYACDFILGLPVRLEGWFEARRGVAPG